MKKAALKELKATLPDVPKYELDRIYVKAKTRYVDSREKGGRMRLAKERDQLIERRLAVNQLTLYSSPYVRKGSPLIS
jgi:hypothetical protein